ncbi:hypothetical protein KAW64_11550 [bacterium]|nr:hypothetical protein [bacterium]
MAVALVVLLLAGCAHVPRESVELSATVGRDLATVHAAHRELAQLLFARMRRDINRFVDEVYVPFQIRHAMDEERRKATSSDPAERSASLLLAIDAAFGPDAPTGLQQDVLAAMAHVVMMIRADVDTMRSALLDSLDAQEGEVLASIDRAYQQLHYANSIVTGHLSSVVGVHETQAELLQAIGIERDLRKDVGENLATASERISELVESAGSADAELDSAEESAEQLVQTLRKLKASQGKGNEED